MDLLTERIELPGGAFAIVYKDVLRRTARLHEAFLRKFMTPVENEKSKCLLSELEASAQLKKSSKPDYTVDLAGIDAAADQINEIFILNQVAEWSFGPVNIDALDNVMTREQYKILVKELDRLYKPSPLPGQP